jgi:hypothetical protein
MLIQDIFYHTIMRLFEVGANLDRHYFNNVRTELASNKQRNLRYDVIPIFFRRSVGGRAGLDGAGRPARRRGSLSR